MWLCVVVIVIVVELCGGCGEVLYCWFFVVVLFLLFVVVVGGGFHFSFVLLCWYTSFFCKLYYGLGITCFYFVFSHITC